MKDESVEMDDNPAIVKEMGLSEGQKIIKTPDLRSLFGKRTRANDEENRTDDRGT